jgi:hypothetical protein
MTTLENISMTYTFGKLRQALGRWGGQLMVPKIEAKILAINLGKKKR